MASQLSMRMPRKISGSVTVQSLLRAAAVWPGVFAFRTFSVPVSGISISKRAGFF